MHEIFLFFTSVFMGFFAIMNPIGNVPVFVGIVAPYDRAVKKKLALRSVIIAFAITTLFIIFGKFIFEVFQITLPAFRITGGILVVMVGFHLLNGSNSPVQQPSEEGQDFKDEMRLAISPLAIPILAGPGTITAAMNAAGTHNDVLGILGIVLVLALVCILTYFLFIAGDKLVKFLGDNIINVISRLMGLIIAVMGTQMVIVGIEQVITEYIVK